LPKLENLTSDELFFICIKDIFDLGHGLYSINIDIYVKQFLFGFMIPKWIL